MDERQLRLRLGFVVLAAAITTAILINQFGDLPMLGSSRYTIYVLFPEAPGISVDTPVRKSGVTLGRVTKWELMHPQGVRVTTSIDSRYTVLDNEVCRISSASVLGDAVLEFIPSNRGQGKPLADGATIEDGIVVGNPLQALVNLETEARGALRSVQMAGEDIQKAAQNLNSALGNNQDQLPRVMQKAERAMDQFSQAMGSVQEIFGDQQTKAELRKAVQEMPQFMAEARQTVGKASVALDNFSTASQRISNAADDVSNIAKTFGERAPEIADNLNSSLASANDLLQNLADFSEGLNSSEGTLGRLLHDKELYNRITRIMANAEDLTRRARPIMDDFRVVSDKLARDPRQLGVKGALDSRPSGTGTKRAFYEPMLGFYEE
jgi:phospholipid/cholesterol/gamma-HCH transport system substrate-binding protein